MTVEIDKGVDLSHRDANEAVPVLYLPSDPQVVMPVANVDYADDAVAGGRYAFALGLARAVFTLLAWLVCGRPRWGATSQAAGGQASRTRPSTCAEPELTPGAGEAVPRRRPAPAMTSKARHTRSRLPGGLNRSSQHLSMLEVFGGQEAAGCGSGAASEDAFAGQVGFLEAG